jgi:hypothetical protein
VSSQGSEAEEAELDRKAAVLEAELRLLQEERLRVTLRAEELRLRKSAHDKCAAFELQLQAELGLKLRGLADEQKAKVRRPPLLSERERQRCRRRRSGGIQFEYHTVCRWRRA